ncbi:retrovirus-related Pol polyprotein from transposon 17.6 [Trichonephila clavipes]|nr:retrovirus-related Pol polyprotein from transposon 17.6 [Trichonephila clavipes]
MIADQMKKKFSPECKEHYLDIWEELISPEMLANKLEAFDNIRSSLPSGTRRHVKASETVHHLQPQRLTKNRRSNQSHQCLHSSDQNNRLTLIDITFSGINGCVCADTGSSHSIVGERMFQIFKDKELLFLETTLAMSLEDGQQTTGDFLTIQGNRTLLGTDFLSSAVLVLDVKNTCWYFGDNPTHKYPFGEELDAPSIVEKMSSNTCQLREGEGGEATNILGHHINTGNSPPISVPPYRMSPVKKEILRKGIEDLLEKDIIEECESPFGAPVVQIPKPNNKFRLCIDYRK